MSMSKLTMKRPERVVTLCLDASLQAEWEQAEKDLIQARSGVQDARLGQKPAAVVAAEKVKELEELMLAEVVHFRLRALPRSKWAEITAANPVVGDDPNDKAFGADKTGFFNDAIPASIIEVTKNGEPVDFDPSKDWEALADEMTDRQYQDFGDVVFSLNRGTVSVPFSRAASRTSLDSSETSK